MASRVGSCEKVWGVAGSDRGFTSAFGRDTGAKGASQRNRWAQGRTIWVSVSLGCAPRLGERTCEAAADLFFPELTEGGRRQVPKNHRGEPTRVTGLFSREGAVPPRQNDMSALAYLRSQAAEARASGEKPYSLFVVSPERVLGMKRAAEVGADAPRDPRPVTRRFASPRPRRKRFFSLQPPSTLTGTPPSPPATIRSRSGASKTAATRRLIATPRRREPRSRRYDPREMTRTFLPSSRLARIPLSATDRS